MSTIRSLIEESKDGEWGKEEYSEGLVKSRIIRGTDFDDVRTGNIENAPIRYIPQHKVDYKQLQANDLLLEVAGGSKNTPTGRSLLITDELVQQSDLPLLCASFCRFIRIKPTEADPEYIFWLLQYLYHSKLLMPYHTQHTGVARFQWTIFADTHELILPSPSNQHKIASVLSAYDDLIEANTRRIQALEESSQALYREWFVEFRFPGHEHVGLVESELGMIPQDWKVVDLENLTTKIGSGATPRGGKNSYKPHGISLIRSLNIYDFSFSEDQLAFIDEEQAKLLSNVEIEQYDVLLNITGASVARCCMTPSYLLPARVNQHVSIIRADKVNLNPMYLLYTINSEYNKQRLLILAQGGATREALTKSTIQSFKIILPPIDLQERFEEQFNDSAMRDNLNQQIRALREARDGLLPRLVSGEVDVSEVDVR